MRLILVRHARSEDNDGSIWRSHPGGKLTSAGRRQAAIVGERLAKENVDAIIASDSPRAVETAHGIIAHHPSLRLQIDSRLREQYLGVLENSPLRDIYDAAQQQNITYVEYRVEGGETGHEVALRALAVIDELRKTYTQGTVVVVTHGWTLKNIFRALHDADPAKLNDYRHWNTGVSIIEFLEEGKFEVKLFSSRDHLPADEPA